MVDAEATAQPSEEKSIQVRQSAASRLVEDNRLLLCDTFWACILNDYLDDDYTDDDTGVVDASKDKDKDKTEGTYRNNQDKKLKKKRRKRRPKPVQAAVPRESSLSLALSTLLADGPVPDSGATREDEVKERRANKGNNGKKLDQRDAYDNEMQENSGNEGSARAERVPGSGGHEGIEAVGDALSKVVLQKAIHDPSEEQPEELVSTTEDKKHARSTSRKRSKSRSKSKSRQPKSRNPSKPDDKANNLQIDQYYAPQTPQTGKSHGRNAESKTNGDSGEDSQSKTQRSSVSSKGREDGDQKPIEDDFVVFAEGIARKAISKEPNGKSGPDSKRTPIDPDGDLDTKSTMTRRWRPPPRPDDFYDGMEEKNSGGNGSYDHPIDISDIAGVSKRRPARDMESVNRKVQLRDVRLLPQEAERSDWILESKRAEHDYRRRKLDRKEALNRIRAIKARLTSNDP